MLDHDHLQSPDARRSLADIERLMTLKRLRKVIETALTHTLTSPATGSWTCLIANRDVDRRVLVSGARTDEEPSPAMQRFALNVAGVLSLQRSGCPPSLKAGATGRQTQSPKLWFEDRASFGPM